MTINIVNQVTVDSNMKVKVFFKNNELAYNDLKWILTFEMKLSRWSQLEIVYYITREESDKFHTSVNVVNEALAE
jgi:hypothetical protein